MREASSYNMIPLPCDNLNEHLFNCGPTSLISSNGYYGYQPQIHHHSRLKNANQHENERPIPNERIQMDVELNNAMETEVQVETSINLPQHRQNKKRRWEHVEYMEGFKKRRESQDVIKDLKINIAKDDQGSLLEDILRETHGVSIYHWLDK